MRRKRHRFINDGRSPFPIGPTAEYMCICGRRGPYEIIERHIAERTAIDNSDDAIVVDADDFGGDTQANYLPNTPRKPAPTEEALPLRCPDTPEPLPPPPSTASSVATPTCPLCGVGRLACDLPEIAAWACGHWIRRYPRSIAEAFQDMLRVAYQAGAASAATNEPFEAWYQREVLQ